VPPEEPDSRIRANSGMVAATCFEQPAHYYRKNGMSTKEIGAALLKYDLEHCEPPYQQTDGKAKVLYIARKKGTSRRMSRRKTQSRNDRSGIDSCG